MTTSKGPSDADKNGRAAGGGDDGGGKDSGTGTAGATDAGEGIPPRDGGSSDTEDHRIILWAIDETSKLHDHLRSRNRELHEYVDRVGIGPSLEARLAVRALNRRGCKLIERISHFELVGVIIG